MMYVMVLNFILYLQIRNNNINIYKGLNEE